MPASIVSTPEVFGGKPCIAGHRIRVSDVVVRHERLGLSPDAIVSDLPSITLADVHAALAYYYENMDAIREEIRVERETADQLLNGRESLVAAKQRLARRVS